MSTKNSLSPLQLVTGDLKKTEIDKPAEDKAAAKLTRTMVLLEDQESASQFIQSQAQHDGDIRYGGKIAKARLKKIDIERGYRASLALITDLENKKAKTSQYQKTGKSD